MTPLGAYQPREGFLRCLPQPGYLEKSLPLNNHCDTSRGYHLLATDDSETLVDRIRNRRAAWTADELADLLALSRKHIYKLAKAGRMPSLRIGGAIRFDPKATANWLEGKTIN